MSAVSGFSGECLLGSIPGRRFFLMKNLFDQSKSFGKSFGTVSKSVRMGMGYAA